MTKDKMRSKWGLFLACAVVLAGVSIAFAAASGDGGQAPGAHVREFAGGGVVALVPPHSAGEGGWCLRRLERNGDGVECGVANHSSASAGPFQGPIIAEAGKGPITVITGSGPPTKTAVVLVDARVAAVSVEGYSKRIATHASALLPDHLRGAVVRLVGDVHKLVIPRFPSGHLIAWSKNGAPISQAFTLGPPLGFDVPSRGWSLGERAPRGVCAISVRGFAEHAFRNGSVMTVVRPHTNVRGREFINCAHSYYLLHEKWPIEANVLLDAEHPGAPPASLPGMHPLTGYRGIFIGPSPENGELARRVAGAWLIVAKGEGIAQRLTLLEHLHVTLRIRRLDKR